MLSEKYFPTYWMRNNPDYQRLVYIAVGSSVVDPKGKLEIVTGGLKLKNVDQEDQGYYMCYAGTRDQAHRVTHLVQIRGIII